MSQNELPFSMEVVSAESAKAALRDESSKPPSRKPRLAPKRSPKAGSVSTTVKGIQDVMRKDAGVDGDAQRLSQLGWMLFLKLFDDREQEYELEPGYRSPIPAPLRWRAWAANEEGVTGDDLLDFVDTVVFPTLKGEPTEYEGETLRLDVDTDRGLLVRSVFEDAYNYMKSGTLLRQVANRLNDIDFTASEDRHVFNDVYESILKDLQSAGNAGEYYTPRAVTRFMAERVDPDLGEVVFDPACGTGGFLVDAIEHLRRKGINSVAERDQLQQTIRGIEKKPLPHLLCTTNLVLHDIEVPDVRHDNSLARPLASYGPADRVDVVLTNPPFGGVEEDGIENNFPLEFRTRETADLFMALIVRRLKDGGRAAVVLPDGFLFGEGVKTRLKERLLAECDLHTIVRLPNGVFAPYTGINTNLLFFEKGRATESVWFVEHPLPDGYKNYSKTKPIRFEDFAYLADWWDDREVTEWAWQVPIEDIERRGYNLVITNPHVEAIERRDPAELLSELEAAQAEVQSTRDALRTALAGSPGLAGRRILTDQLEKFVSTFESIERLRTFVISLAVRGRLTEQDSADEPASALLQHIAAEKQARYEAGEIRKSKMLSPVGEDEQPFEVPEGWAWVRFGTVADHRLGKMLDKQKNEGTLRPYLRNVNVRWFDFDLSDLKEMRIQDAQVEEYSVQRGDLLICEGGEPGRCAVWDREGSLAFQKALHRARPFADVSPEYLGLVLKAAADSDRLADNFTGATIQHLTGKSLAVLAIPLPPLAEQARIVARVDELTALCDRLAAKLAEADKNAERLMRAVLEEALAAPGTAAS